MTHVLTSRRLFTFIAALFALKALAMIAFSYVEVVHGALNSDFAIFYQAWSLIARGILSPYSTMVGQPFWKDHLSTAMWPLAIIGIAIRSPLALKVVQDLASAGADLIGALWTLDILRRFPNVRPAAALALLAATLLSLLLNPWTFYTDAFDFHFYTISELFLMGSLWSFYRGWRVVGVLCALGISTGGDVNATYALGVGVTVALADRRLWKEGLIIVVASFGLVVGMHKLGAGTGSGISTAYGYLSTAGVPQVSVLSIARGIVQHPGTVLGVLWEDRLRIYSNLGPSGWIGYFCPWAIGPWSVLLLENVLHRGLGGHGQSRFSLPGFQFGVGYAVLAPAATWVILWLRRWFRSERFVLVASALVAANALGWGITWLPYLSTTFVRVPVALADDLYRLDTSTSDDVQLSASQGVVGGLADRTLVGQYFGRFDYALYGKRLRLVVTPYDGIEVATVEESAAAIAEMLDSPRAQVLRASNGLWVFDYDIVDGATRMRLSTPRPFLPAAAFATDVGERVLGKTAKDSSLEVNGANAAAGYLLKLAYFRRPPGQYHVGMDIAAESPLLIEVRDASRDVLLASRMYRDPMPRHLDIPISLPFSGGDDLFDGVGPFISPAWRSSPYDQLEVRAWAPPHARAKLTLLGVSGRDPVER